MVEWEYLVCSEDREEQTVKQNGHNRHDEPKGFKGGRIHSHGDPSIEILNNMTLIHRDYPDYTLFSECMHNT